MALLWRTLTSMSVLLMAACGTFEAETMEGAQCKQECSMNMQNCTASEEICETAFDHCEEPCNGGFAAGSRLKSWLWCGLGALSARSYLFNTGA